MSVDVAQVRNFLERKDAAEKQERKELFLTAESDVKKMIEHIKSRYDVSSIYQWGSLLHSEDFDKNSDIDIAIEGLKSSKQFFKLYGELDKMTGFPVDLVELDRIDPIHKKSILRKGKLVYGKS